ncbi:MAG: ABC-F family ATP-binding cassette domain-containing protein [Bdellovibrionales bacterium]|nr:ABC-F family ATP-binding cassette domain-containing protein [Bdellovibrionales bacterium]
MSALINAKSIGKSYEGREIFSNVNFSISSGDHIAVVGPNGAGKSTLLKILAGLEEADIGEIFAQRNLTISYVAQSTEFSPNESVSGLLRQAAKRSGVNSTLLDSEVSKILSLIQIHDPDKTVEKLSGGWRKRLAIGIALIKA